MFFLIFFTIRSTSLVKSEPSSFLGNKWVYGFMGGCGAVRCIFPSTAYESNTVHPRLVAKSKANICTGTHSTHQDRGDHRKENKFNEVMITITND